MNWTEGALVRHSRPSKGREVLLRQKEYFAKARAGVLSANVKTRPPSVTFLAHPALSSPARHRSSNPKTSAPSSSKKRSLDHDPANIIHYSLNDNELKLPTVADFQEVQIKEEALRQKRRKLLLKGDWTGISLQKPIEMEFSKPRASHGGPWGYSKSRHAKSKSRMRHVLGTKCDTAQARDPKVVVKTTGPNSPVQMRVRVGSRERVFGDSANISPQSKACRDVITSPQVSHNPESTHIERQLPRTYQGKTHASGAGHQAPNWPELHQPFPLRSFMQSLFRSPSSISDDAATTGAQVGVLEPNVSASLVAGNKAWWSFVGREGRTQSAGDLQSPNRGKLAVQREISPGISQLGWPETIGNANGEVDLDETPTFPDNKADEHFKASAQRQRGILQSHELGSFFGRVSEDAEALPTDDEASSASMGSGSFSSTEDPKTGDTVALAHQPGPPNADVVSMQVMPLSFNLTSEELVPRTRNDTDFRDHIDNVDASSILPGPDLQKDAATDQGQLPKPSSTKKDNSDMWRDFVLDDYDYSLQEAFKEATKETARNLQPSESPTSTGEDDSSVTSRLDVESLETTAALRNDPYLDVPNFTDQNDSSSTDTCTVAAVSHIATFGHSSSDPLCGPDTTDSCIEATVGRSSPNLPREPDPADMFIKINVESSPDPLSTPAPSLIVQTDQVTVESSSLSKNALLSLADEFLSRNDGRSLVTGVQDDTSLVGFPPSTAEHSEADDTFKFARPKPFLGKKRAHIDEQRQIALSAPQIRGKGVTRRRQKRTRDGRASIRHVPNSNSDPIEEVEDALPVKGAQKPSLFGSLDTDEGLC